MSVIYFIRHGQASFGDENYDRLSETGKIQAGLVAEYFMKSGIIPDSLYSGTLARQKDTLSEMISVFETSVGVIPEPVVLKEFDEYDSMSLLKFFVPVIIEKDPALKNDLDNAFKSRKSFQRIYEHVISEWCSGNFTSDEFLSWDEFSGEVKAGLLKIMQASGRGEKIVVVTSGGPISAVAGMSLGMDSLKTLKLGWEIVNASLTRIRCTENRFMLSSFNEYSHLEINNDQSLITYR